MTTIQPLSKTLAMALGVSLLATGCSPGLVYPLASQGQCGGATNISASISKANPGVTYTLLNHVDDDNDPNTPADNDDADPNPDARPATIGGDELTFSTQGDFSDVSIEYRVGVYDNNGLPSLDQEMLFEPYSQQGANYGAFLDVLEMSDFGFGEGQVEFTFPYPLPGIGVNGASATGHFSQLVFGSENLDTLISFGPEILYLTTMPGAFLLKCDLLNAPNQYIGAVQMFPNLINLEGTPTAAVNAEGDLELRLPMFPNHYVFALGRPIVGSLPNLNASPATNRWLHLYYDQPEGPVTNLTGPPEEISETGEVTLDLGQEFAPGNKYNMILFLADISDGEVPLGTYTISKSVIFDLDIDAQGVGTVSPFVASERTTRRPRLIPPSISDLRTSLGVSTRGHREVTLIGSSLNRITGAQVGQSVASVISTDGALATFALPKQKPGVYDLTLFYSGGEIVKPRFVEYKQSSNLAQLRILSSQTKSAWTATLRSALTKNPSTVQVNCVARVPSGTKAASVKEKASEVCGSIGDSSIKTRVVVKKVPASQAASVAVNLWD